VEHLTINSESRLRLEVKEINKLRDYELLNEDAISTLSDQVAKLVNEIEILKAKK
jgi:hypothetical protein